MMSKVYNVESQVINSETEAFLFYECIRLANEAGYTNVKDHWADGCYDEMRIDEALHKFKPLVTEDSDDGDLPF